MIFIFVPDSDLPKDIQRWFDPEQSLPKNVRLVSHRQSSGLGHAIGACSFAALALLEGIVSTDASGIDRILGFGITVAAAGAALWFALGYQEAKSTLKAIANGRYRYGSFVHPQFLLVRQMEWALLLPWENIISYTTRAVHSGESWGRHWELEYRNERGVVVKSAIGLGGELHELKAMRLSL